MNPYSVRVLEETYGIDASGARSKSWAELAGRSFDFVITVCDGARETCPIWPGRPIAAHWGMEDPAAGEGGEDEKLETFRQAAIEIGRRPDRFRALPLETLDRRRLEPLLRQIVGSD